MVAYTILNTNSLPVTVTEFNPRATVTGTGSATFRIGSTPFAVPFTIAASGATIITADYSSTPSGNADTTSQVVLNTTTSIAGTRGINGFTYTVTNNGAIPSTVVATAVDGAETQTIAAGAMHTFFMADTTRTRDGSAVITSSRMLYNYRVRNTSTTVPIIATIEATVAGATEVSDHATSDFILATVDDDMDPVYTTIEVGSEFPTYTAYSRQGRDLVNHPILTVTNGTVGETNALHQDFTLRMITHGSENTYATGATITHDPLTNANLTVAPATTRTLFATARVTDNTVVGRIELGAGNDHSITGTGRYTGDASTINVAFDSNSDQFDFLTGVSHTFTGLQTDSEAATELEAALDADMGFNDLFEANILTTAALPEYSSSNTYSTNERVRIADVAYIALQNNAGTNPATATDDWRVYDPTSTVRITVDSDNRARFTPRISVGSGTTPRNADGTAGTPLSVIEHNILASGAEDGDSSSITISVGGDQALSVNATNNRRSVRPDGFDMPERDLPAFFESVLISFNAAFAGAELAAEIARVLNADADWPFATTIDTTNPLQINFVSRDTTVGTGDTAILQPSLRAYNEIDIDITSAGIAVLEESDFTINQTQVGQTNEIHGKNTQLEVNILTLDSTMPNAEPTRERIGDIITLASGATPQQVAAMVAARFNERSVAGYVIDYDGDRTIDLRLADLSVVESNAFEVRTMDINTRMFVNNNSSTASPLIITGSISGTTRPSSPTSTDNSLFVDASGNAEIFNNERPWPTDEFNDARTFVVMAQPGRNALVAADIGFTFPRTPTMDDPSTVRNYISFFERTQIDLSAVVDDMATKHLKSVYIQSQAITGQQNANFDVKVRATNTPASIPDLTLARDAMGTVTNTDNQVQQAVDFNTNDDYKSDVRVTGRYLSYRVEDNEPNGWSIPAIELEIDIAGRR